MGGSVGLGGFVRNTRTVAVAELTEKVVLVIAAGLMVLVAVRGSGRGWRWSAPPHTTPPHPTYSSLTPTGEAASPTEGTMWSNFRVCEEDEELVT